VKRGRSKRPSFFAGSKPEAKEALGGGEEIIDREMQYVRKKFLSYRGANPPVR